MFWVGLDVGFQISFCFGVCAARLCGAIFVPCCEGEGDFLDVLGCGRAPALLFEMQETPPAGMAVTVTLFGIRNGPFNSVLSAFINGLAPIGPAMRADFVPSVLPDMATVDPGPERGGDPGRRPPRTGRP